MGSISSPKDVPYWHVNVPPSEQTEECPEFLRNLTPKDLGIISTPDAQYHILTWAEVRQIIATNRLDLFQRKPSDLRRYLAHNWKLKQDYGSIMNFVLSQRLMWKAPIRPAGEKSFEDEGDVKVLWNDWPYGLDERIVHLVVWTKFELDEDPDTGDLTEKARAEIDAFVNKTFGGRVLKDNYVWFKNWRSLKSVHAVEHFHVMLFGPDRAFIDEVTNGDILLCRKV